MLAVVLFLFGAAAKIGHDADPAGGVGRPNDAAWAFTTVFGESKEPLGPLVPHLALLVGTITHYANADDRLQKSRVVLAITYLASAYWQGEIYVPWECCTLHVSP